MKKIKYIFYLFLFLAVTGCIVQFVPKTTEDKEILVVEGLITNLPGPYTIKLTRSYPLGGQTAARPVHGYIVSVTDDLSNNYVFGESTAGSYVSSGFQASIGRTYTLHISTNSGAGSVNYTSFPVEMLPVPPIDSIYYEKQTLGVGSDNTPNQEGCQVYLDTHDPTGKTRFYRWEYQETWQFALPYIVTNKDCWISENSDIINIKNLSGLDENRIKRFPLKFISNTSDRLNVKYSILVNQLSITEDEYSYWDKLVNLSQSVGGLYDVIPSSVSSNIYCPSDPNEKVLGYFSVSGSSSKRLFIKDHFAGLANLYTTCAGDTVPPGTPLQGLNSTVWIIINHGMPDPYWVLTYNKGCADCTVRGTNIRPDFWDSGK